MSKVVYTGNYLGIVVQNNDPEKRGRAKVFVPHINIALYDNWNKDFSGSSPDKHFIFPDQSTNPDLDKVLDYLKKSLPWAEIALPPFGGSATGRYNAHLRKGTTSDSNAWEGDTPVQGFRPLVNLTGDGRVSDAFSKTDVSHNRLVNPNANQYTPSDYSNLARGLFTIPNVGAHVWVFFVEGDINYPVIFAVSHGQEDWKRIYSKNKEAEDIAKFISPDYPESFENLDAQDSTALDHNKKTFRAKHVFNSNKHSLEFVDTDHEELLKMTHFSGSFFEMNNNTMSTFSANNDQKLVLGDQFLTVRKSQAIYIANYQETIIDGDRITKLGDFVRRSKIVKQIIDILRPLSDYKRLFEIMRINPGDKPDMNDHMSTKQKRDGEFAPCPVCGGSGEKFGSPCITCKKSLGGAGKSPSTQWGKWTDDTVSKWIDGEVTFNRFGGRNYSKPDFSSDTAQTKDIAAKIHDAQKQLIDLELEAKFGNGGDDLEAVTGSRITTIGTVFNDLPSYRIDPIGKLRDQGAHLAKEGTYVSMAECPMVEYVDVDSLPGGDWDVTVSNRYRLHVGSRGINIRTTGPLDMYGTIMNISAEALNISSEFETLIEGKKRVEIRGDVINLHPNNGLRCYVLLDGNVGVRNNLTVVGGAHIEGELSFLHCTAVKKKYATDLGYGPIAHRHNYYAPEWDLLEDCNKVRESMRGVNEPMPVANMKCKGFWVPT